MPCAMPPSPLPLRRPAEMCAPCSVSRATPTSTPSSSTMTTGPISAVRSLAWWQRGCEAAFGRSGNHGPGIATHLTPDPRHRVLVYAPPWEPRPHRYLQRSTPRAVRLPHVWAAGARPVVQVGRCWRVSGALHGAARPARSAGGPAGSRRACRRPGAGAVVLRAAAARPSLVPPRARLRLVSRHARARDLRIRPRGRGLRLAPSQAAGLTFAPVVQSGVCAVEWDQLVLAEAAGGGGPF